MQLPVNRSDRDDRRDRPRPTSVRPASATARATSPRRRSAASTAAPRTSTPSPRSRTDTARLENGASNPAPGGGHGPQAEPDHRGEARTRPADDRGAEAREEGPAEARSGG